MLYRGEEGQVIWYRHIDSFWPYNLLSLLPIQYGFPGKPISWHCIGYIMLYSSNSTCIGNRTVYTSYITRYLPNNYGNRCVGFTLETRIQQASIEAKWLGNGRARGQRSGLTPCSCLIGMYISGEGGTTSGGWQLMGGRDSVDAGGRSDGKRIIGEGGRIDGSSVRVPCRGCRDGRARPAAPWGTRERNILFEEIVIFTGSDTARCWWVGKTSLINSGQRCADQV